MDINEARIAGWNSEKLPIYEPGLLEIVQEARGRNLFFSTDVNKHVAEADIVFVRWVLPGWLGVARAGAPVAGCWRVACWSIFWQRRRPVPACHPCLAPAHPAHPSQQLTLPLPFHPPRSVNTPTKTRGVGAGKAADLTYWEGAARVIASVSKTSKIIVEKSTVPVKTADAIEKVLRRNCSDPEVQFEILSNPEFLAEGTAIEDLTTPDRVLIGGKDTDSGRKAIATLAR